MELNSCVFEKLVRFSFCIYNQLCLGLFPLLIENSSTGPQENYPGNTGERDPRPFATKTDLRTVPWKPILEKNKILSYKLEH